MRHNDELDVELRWLFTNKFWATRYMKVERMGITEILRRIWVFSANKIKSSESFDKQPTQIIVKLNSLRHIIVTIDAQTEHRHTPQTICTLYSLQQYNAY